MSEIQFVNLGPLEYDRAKTIFNKAKHPGFIGRELFFRCASTGVACVAVLDEADVGIALIAKERLQALSVVTAAQGRGIGPALMNRLRPKWVSAISEKVGFFEKLGYKSFGAPKIGQNGKHATQLMQADEAFVADDSQVKDRAPESATANESEADAVLSLFSLADRPLNESSTAQLTILDGLYKKAVVCEKFDSALKILEQASLVLRRAGALR